MREARSWRAPGESLQGRVGELAGELGLAVVSLVDAVEDRAAVEPEGDPVQVPVQNPTPQQKQDADEDLPF